ncbi:MAG: hypothetical protein KAI47_01410 [Deltaproteobacteria bacterium]|nr:hypothetical protein [Deltaproteobacteria bacterium]
MPRLLFTVAMTVFAVTVASGLSPRARAQGTPPPAAKSGVPPTSPKTQVHPGAPAAAAKAATKKAAPAVAADDEEEIDDEDDDDTTAVPKLDLSKAPFSPAQKKFLEAWAKHLRASLPKAPPPQSGSPMKLSLRWRAETFTKILYQNDQTQGAVSFGTPHPRGDNYSGNNGFASEISLYLDGRVSDRVNVGVRIKSRWGRQWAEFYENGDLAVDETGIPRGADGTGESLGMNHAAYIQLRGLYIDVRPPIPTIKRFRAGSSDLGMYNAWTVGRVRFIDRDNANGLFLDGTIPKVDIDYHLARISLPKLFASAGYTSGIADPIVANPFWTRDATYVLKLAQRPTDSFNWRAIASYLIDEEADLNDPDSLGSTNFIDKKDGIVATLPRYQNVNATAELQYTKGFFDGNLLLGYSFSDPDLSTVFNSVDGNQGISPIPMKRAHGYAIKARTDLTNLFGIGLDLRLEYFNISEDWVATFGARRETDVLLTDGFVDGQVPTLNVANEFIDWRDKFYESIIGWHGATFSPKLTRGSLEVEAEFTFLEYNTDAQNRCTGANITDEHGVPIASQVCPQDPNTGKFYGVYPNFLFPDGMTDTDFFSYANTNDRGRDPRAVYKQNQARRTFITMAKLAYLFDVGRGLKVETKVKYIYDRDLRDKQVIGDDYAGHLLFTKTQMATQITDEFSLRAGFRLDYWKEAHRSGAIVGNRPDYPDYETLKVNVFLDLKYQLGGATFAWYMEWVNKDVKVTRNGQSDDQASFAFKNVVRGIGTISTQF